MEGQTSEGRERSPETALRGKTALVFVQGPLEQSPRMAAQAAMLAASGARVRALGFGRGDEEAWRRPGIELRALSGAGRDLSARKATHGRLLRAAGRLLGGTVTLSRALRRELRGADLVLAQLPPALPGVWLAAGLARRRGVPLVLDWHNLSAPLAGLKFGPRHPMLALLERVERSLARRAALQFAVTAELAAHLERAAGVPAIALPDRPVAAGGTVPPALDAQALVARLGRPPLCRSRRWRSVVSPTSWSLDEDSDLLLEAAARLRIPGGLGLLIAATGKGPRRPAFERRAVELARPGLRLETGWLDEAGYRAMLRGADCGVSLHRSASGLDFPMKLVDMEAAGLPVAALDYGPVLRAGLAGRPDTARFADAQELADFLQRLLEQGPPPRAAAGGESWEQAWRRLALPALARLP